MLIQLKKTWTFTSSQVDPNDSRISSSGYNADKWEFDTATRSVVYTPYPDGGSYSQYTGEGLPDPPPENEGLDPAFEFYVVVAGPTRTGYFHDDNGGFTTVTHTLTLAAEVTGVRCHGSATGAVRLRIAGGRTGQYVIVWADGPAATAERTALRAGTYTVVVTEASGARESLTVVVPENPRLEVLIDQVGGDVQLTASGGVAPYFFDWSDGGEGPLRRGLPAGVYQVLLSDALGCSTEFTLDVESASCYFVGNPITLALDAGDAYRLDPATKPNLSFCCEVFVEQEYLSEEFVPLATVLEQPADRDGRTLFEVQELLAPYLDYHVPAPGLRGSERATPLFRRFYLRYFERFGDPAPVAAPSTVQAQHYVLLGGLDFYEARSRTWFTSYQAGVRPFFTWEPNDKAVAADQPEFLYAQLPAAGPFFRTYRVRYDDGSLGPAVVEGLLLGRRFELHCWAVGLRALGLVDEAERRIAGWEVWLNDGTGTPQTEVRRFQLDRRPLPRRRYFIFATSLGGVATFAATGEAQLDAEVSGDEAERPLPPGYDPQRGDVAVLERALRPVLKVASGLRTRAQMAAAQDLLLSRRVLLLNGPRWLPGYFKAKTVQLREDGKNLPTLELDFYLPRQRYYTPRLPAGTRAGQPVLPLTDAHLLLP